MSKRKTATGVYIPALRYEFLTGMYDAVIRRLLPEARLKTRLISQATVQDGDRVLDIGAGTATLTLMIKASHPRVEVVGIDGDPRVLALARSKASVAGLPVLLNEGLATALPYPDAAFDRVFTSLMLHHLTAEEKRAALGEAFRVLRPGGELHILDFGKPHTALTWLISLVFRHLERTQENIRGLLPEMMRQAGFSRAFETEHHVTILGTLSLYRGIKVS